MGQCNSSLYGGADAACEEVRPRVINTNDSTTGRASGPKKKTLQVSVSLDQETDHTLCIRVELADGGQVSALELSSSRLDRSGFCEKEDGVQPAHSLLGESPKHQYYSDICFTPRPDPPTSRYSRNHQDEPSVFMTTSSSFSDEGQHVPNQSNNDDYRRGLAQKIDSRRSAFRRHRQQPSLSRLATSDGALLKKSRQSAAAVQKENSWYHLGEGMDSLTSLDLKDTFLQLKNCSTHSKLTTSSWGGLSLHKTLKLPGSSSKPSVVDPGSMNDISGNTLPTRVDYEDHSETENDHEVDDDMWDYRRNIRALTSSDVGARGEEKASAMGPPMTGLSLPGSRSSRRTSRSCGLEGLDSGHSLSDRSHWSSQSEPGARHKRRDSGLKEARLLEPWNPHHWGPSFSLRKCNSSS